MKYMMRYVRRKELAENYKISVNTVDRILAVVKDQIGKRYPEDAIIDIGGRLLIDEDCFHDALVYRMLIPRGLAPAKIMRKERD